MNKPVVVIGAGLAGMNAAAQLQNAGREVVVLEAADRAGGRVQSDQIDGFTCDRGFQLINAKYPELVTLNLLDKIDFRFADRAINVAIDEEVHRLGDPRKYLKSVFDSATGSLLNKAALLKVLAGRPSPKISIHEYLSASGLGETYEKVLRPFLRGVYLTDLSNISADTGLEIIKTFIGGKPGLPRAGVGALSAAMANEISDLRLCVTVNSIKSGLIDTSDGVIQASEIIVATDSTTSAQLLDQTSVTKLASCTTWYHNAPKAPVSHGQLIVDGQNRGSVINTLVISNFIPEYAPTGKNLVSSTTDVGVTESEVRRHLATMYNCDNRDWELIAKYEIPAALPIGTKRITQPIESRIRDGIYLAGDGQVGPSQNGALKSGRLAAIAVLAN
ncbi:MAG: NAD(P)/FAD-dependent oxidoreductase [Actinobacteria bacterium]|nr:NAD(P)/FAD-dependent oxidoreductase [Actinomycetota bacterium]